MQGADTALPAGDRDPIYSVISRPDYLKGTGSGWGGGAELAPRVSLLTVGTHAWAEEVCP
jgi:hypothetical protein